MEKCRHDFHSSIIGDKYPPLLMSLFYSQLNEIRFFFFLLAALANQGIKRKEKKIIKYSYLEKKLFAIWNDT